MASDHTIRETILQPMAALYAPPKHVDDPLKALNEYIPPLRKYDAMQLKSGWERFVTRHKFKSWPVPGELVAAIEDVPQKTGETSKNIPSWVALDMQADEHTKAIERHPTYLQAVSEGWASQLRSAVWQSIRIALKHSATYTLDDLIRKHAAADSVEYWRTGKLPSRKKA